MLLAHIMRNKLKSNLSEKTDLWHKTVVVKIECELRSMENGKFFNELCPKGPEDIGPEFAVVEGDTRLASINDYRHKMSEGTEFPPPLYTSGSVLNYIGADINPKDIYMLDGARRIVAWALNHRRAIPVYLLIMENEFIGIN